MLEKTDDIAEQLKVLTEQSIMGIAIIQDNIIKYANEAMARITEEPMQKLIDSPFMDFISKVHPKDLEFAINQAKKKQEQAKDITVHYTSRLIPSSGKLKWVELYSRTIIYRGKPADFINVIDITEKKNAEQKLQESEEKYRTAYNRANFYKDLLAHDINNILQGILSSTELCSINLEPIKLAEDTLALLNIIKGEIYRGSNLISNVKKLSDMEDSRSILKTMDVSQILKECVDSVGRRFEKGRVNVNIESHTERFKVKANEFLTELIENLLTNAIVHNENPKAEISIRITITEKDDEEYLKMEFIDNGMGITSDRKDILFGRTPKIYKDSGRLGIGLYLVKQIIESYNGLIWVSDKVQGDPSKGSNFTVLIPLAS